LLKGLASGANHDGGGTLKLLDGALKVIVSAAGGERQDKNQNGRGA